MVINAPSSFTAIWSAVKPWLAKETVKKIDILGANYKEVLLDAVDAENLPSSFGGTCQCAGGCELSNAGPWLEERRRQLGVGQEKLPLSEHDNHVDSGAEAICV